MSSNTEKNDAVTQQKRHKKGPMTLARKTQRILGVPVAAQEFPGGKGRASRAMILEDGRRVIATRRKEPRRAKTERGVLRALRGKSVNVPTLLGHDKKLVLIQEEITGQRFTRAIAQASEREYSELMGAALTSLADIHKAGSESGLDKALPVLGHDEKWISSFIQHPAKIGYFYGIKPPRPDVERLAELLKVRQPRFIKWDARPGNALISEKNEVVWFDWEHAGCRNRLDDMAWVMGDEFVPEHPKAEAELMMAHIDLFRDDLSRVEAYEYLLAYASLHQMVRLGLILRNKKNGEWWDLDTCIDGDKVGVTLECALRLCRRAARWSAKSPAIAALSPWFMEVGQAILDNRGPAEYLLNKRSA